MTIAFTADVHLRSYAEYPERYHALDNILHQLSDDSLNVLVVAGDLFDAGRQNYAEFDELCGRYSNIRLLVIRGNHDPDLNSRALTAKNVKVIENTQKITFGDPPVDFLFVPYINDKTMGEEISRHSRELSGRWVLVGHGDYQVGLQNPNPYEPGVYMPLTRRDIDTYKPSVVTLGHIHKKADAGRVHYVGSPCALDITETGRRSFLVLDTNTLETVPKKIETDYIVFDETLIALPMPDEFGFFREKLESMTAGWGLSDNEIARARLRLTVKGYTSDKKQLEEVVSESLRAYAFYKEEGVDLKGGSVFDNADRAQIVQKVKEKIDALELASGAERPEKDGILELALRMILRK